MKIISKLKNFFLQTIIVTFFKLKHLKSGARDLGQIEME